MSTSYSHVIFPPVRMKGCTDAEYSRYALANVLLHQRGNRWWLAATDGRKLALVPSEGNSEGWCLICCGGDGGHGGDVLATIGRDAQGTNAPRQSVKCHPLPQFAGLCVATQRLASTEMCKRSAMVHI
jgi:hypothetical protein